MRKAKIKAEEKIRMSSTKQVYDRLNDLIIGAGIPICANQLEIDFPDEIFLARQNTNVKDSLITKNTQINDVVGHLLEIQGIDQREILTSLSAIKPAVKTKETI